MQTYEYKAVPAPNRPKRYKGIKGNAARFAEVLSELINELAVDGWEYQRSDSLPVEEKPGLLKGRIETYHTLLIFRRARVGAGTANFPLVEAPETVAEPDTPLRTIVAPIAAPAAVSALGGGAEPFAAVSTPDSAEGYPQDPPMTATPSHPEEDGPLEEPESEDSPQR